jgi:ribosomal protein S18 acetylase RimI-like enzyme
VIHYRTFRNTDPPALGYLWNACFPERGAIAFRGTTLLEYFLFAKPYFDPAGLIVAHDETAVIGFALSGFGPNADGSGLDLSSGVVCVVGVHPGHRRQGIGRELLRQSEAYLRQQGSQTIYAGPLGAFNPFTFGLYGGSQAPGFLESDTAAQPFLLKQGYQISKTCLVLQKTLDSPVTITDGRFAAFRQRMEIHAGPQHVTTWSQECLLGPVELHEYRVHEKGSKRVLAWANLWEMDTFSMRWNEHAVGFVGLEVDPAFRRQGLAKFLIAQLLRHLQDQFFSLAEFQVLEDNAPALALLRGIGFQQVDIGRQYRLA